MKDEETTTDERSMSAKILDAVVEEQGRKPISVPLSEAGPLFDRAPNRIIVREREIAARKAKSRARRKATSRAKARVRK